MLSRAVQYSVTLEEERQVARTVDCTVAYRYDKEGNLTKKTVTHADGTEQTVYYETNEGNTIAKFKAEENTVTSHSKTDSFGRKLFDELQLGTGVLSRAFEYHKGTVTEEHSENGKVKSTPTTQLVSLITLSDGRTIAYEYDAEERITKVTDSIDGVTEYTYDALGQLLTETVTKDGVSTVVNSMEYDNYGNILSKNGKAYTYGDGVWKDLLTAYDGQSISYDAQGNPTSYLGHTLTWEKGRQLKSFDGNTYTYNANGIRTSKTVGGVTHTYTLDGTKILKETWGENTLVPLYDNEDSVCGIVYNGTPYYFVKNLQGDVIAIVDKTAQTVARYAYDAWGVPTIVSDTADGIGSINPYRYRSYYYDAEIAKYYLQSRYYDAQTGRFVNGDRPEFSLFSTSVVAHDLFAYCLNSPTNFIDPTGYVALVDDLAIAALLAAFAILMLLLALVSTPEFKKAWNAFCVDVGNGMAWIGTAIINGGKAIWGWTRAQVKAAMAAVNAYIAVIKAERKIKSEVKNNSKKRYWMADIIKQNNYSYVVITSAISYTMAKARVALGLSVFTVTKTEARKLASNYPPVVGPEKGLKNEGQYMHYHVRNRRSKAHIFFMF